MNMKNPRVFALVLAALPLALAASAVAAEGPRSNAVASFLTRDADGCVTTETSVFARRDGARKEHLEMRILRVNECTETGLVDARVDTAIPNGSLKIAAGHSTVSLQVSATAVDQFSKTTFPVSVSLKWQAEDAGATAMRQEEPTALGKFKRNAKAVRRTVRISGASGTISFNQTRLALKSAESAWIDNSVSQ